MLSLALLLPCAAPRWNVGIQDCAVRELICFTVEAQMISNYVDSAPRDAFHQFHCALMIWGAFVGRGGCFLPTGGPVGPSVC